MLRRFSLKEGYTVTINFLTILSQTFVAGCSHRPGAGLPFMTTSDMKNINAATAEESRLVGRSIFHPHLPPDPLWA